MKVRVAVAPGGREWSTESYLSLVDGLEVRGFDTIWLSDVPLSPSIDPIVGLALAAGRTRRLKLGANVVPLGRNPAALAKALAQIDQLSNGRLLLMMVPGIGLPTERQALGIAGADRGRLLEEVVGLLRRFWSGEDVAFKGAHFEYSGVHVRPLPLQQPLELWMGGMGPRALERAGRVADGWLGAALTPAEAGKARRSIEEAATRAGRLIDPEHFGLSIAYSREQLPASSLAALAQRRPDLDPAALVPQGRQQLRDFLSALIDQGLSKFVLRPSGPGTLPAGSGATEGPRDPAGASDLGPELDWLAEAVLDLQT